MGRPMTALNPLPFAEYLRIRQSAQVSGAPGYYLVRVTMPDGTIREDRAMQNKRPGLLWITAFLTRCGIVAAD